MSSCCDGSIFLSHCTGFKSIPNPILNILQSKLEYVPVRPKQVRRLRAHVFHKRPTFSKPSKTTLLVSNIVEALGNGHRCLWISHMDITINWTLRSVCLPKNWCFLMPLGWASVCSLDQKNKCHPVFTITRLRIQNKLFWWIPSFMATFSAWSECSLIEA